VSVHQGIRKAFSELRQETEKLAAGFLALGLEKGDRIGIWGPNTYEWYITQLAAGKAGLVLVSPKLFGGPIHTLILVEI
jgi:long-subunit acyl-CoA synthetase (AMP-forming)